MPPRDHPLNIFSGPKTISPSTVWSQLFNIFQTFKVGPSSTPSSSSSLFYMNYKISTSSSSDYIYFAVPGLSTSVLRSLTTTSYQRLKIEYRLSGASCLTIMHFQGTEILNKLHNCGSYTTGDTKVWAAGYHSSGHQAIGWVDTFNFVWL